MFFSSVKLPFQKITQIDAHVNYKSLFLKMQGKEKTQQNRNIEIREKMKKMKNLKGDSIHLLYL